MNLPSFSAKASLYEESGHYRTAGAHTQADGAIQPAWLRRDSCWYRDGERCCWDPDSQSAFCHSILM
jgi:hypothetical protein